jgi:hypothetical protein
MVSTTIPSSITTWIVRAEVVGELRDFTPRAGEKCPGRVTMERETEVVGVRTGEDGEVRDRRATVDVPKSGACEESWIEGGDK